MAFLVKNVYVLSSIVEKKERGKKKRKMVDSFQFKVYFLQIQETTNARAWFFYIKLNDWENLEVIIKVIGAFHSMT